EGARPGGDRRHRGRDHRRPARRRDAARADPGPGAQDRAGQDRQRDPQLSDPGGGHPEARGRLQPDAADADRQDALPEVAGLDPVGPATAPPRLETGGGRRGRWARIALLLALLAAGVLLARTLGLPGILGPDALARLRARIDAAGAWGPVLFIAGYALAELIFVPALPLTLLGGLVFGPVRGTIVVSIGATLGAALAFLAARYAARGLVESWVRASPRLARIDAAVTEHGWRILMITRLIPLFPFNLPNLAFRPTRIPFSTFVGPSLRSLPPA